VLRFRWVSRDGVGDGVGPCSVTVTVGGHPGAGGHGADRSGARREREAQPGVLGSTADRWKHAPTGRRAVEGSAPAGPVWWSRSMSTELTDHYALVASPPLATLASDPAPMVVLGTWRFPANWAEQAYPRQPPAGCHRIGVPPAAVWSAFRQQRNGDAGAFRSSTLASSVPPFGHCAVRRMRCAWSGVNSCLGLCRRRRVGWSDTGTCGARCMP
jgi:hypothetical protein